MRTTHAVAKPSTERSLRDALRAGDRAANRAALAILRRDLGSLRAALVVARVAWGRARGAPFTSLGPPVDIRDRLTRRQCGPVVLLYQALRQETNVAHARAIVRAVVLAGAMPFLDRMIPPLPRDELAKQGPALAQRFFNAEGEVRMLDAHTLAFDVRRCRFVELLTAVGTPELAPLFCEVDRTFFARKRRPVALYRRLTLAGGDDHCDFRFEAVDD